MAEYEDKERKRQKRIKQIEESLRSDVRRQRKKILSRIRNIGAKNVVIGLFAAMTLFSNYNKAYADTNNVKREVVKFNDWLGENMNRIKEGEITHEPKTMVRRIVRKQCSAI